MPRRTKAQRTRKKKKTMKKKVPYHSPYSVIRKPQYSAIFHNDSTTAIVNNSTASTDGNITFTLTSCEGYSEYVAIFDYYRINWVEVSFIPCRTQMMTTQTNQTTAPSSLTQIPLFITCIDRDSSTAPLDYEAMQKRGGTKETLATEKQVWKFTPNRLVEVYKSAVSSGYKIDGDTRQFLDCANSDVPHYGLKYSMEASGPLTAMKTYIRIKYSVSFAGKRN